jgi:hypothetical protein
VLQRDDAVQRHVSVGRECENGSDGCDSERAVREVWAVERAVRARLGSALAQLTRVCVALPLDCFPPCATTTMLEHAQVGTTAR